MSDEHKKRILYVLDSDLREYLERYGDPDSTTTVDEVFKKIIPYIFKSEEVLFSRFTEVIIEPKSNKLNFVFTLWYT